LEEKWERGQVLRVLFALAESEPTRKIDGAGRDLVLSQARLM
jgi:hypothetical protein